MQRTKQGLRTGYQARRIALRKRKTAGPQPGQPATTHHIAAYVVRVRTSPERQREAWADYVRALRDATGVSRAELARRLGVDPTTVWRWETRRQKPESPEVPQALAELFALDLDEVLAAAGLKPDALPPAEPTVERDEEVEAILAAPVSKGQQKRMLELLFQMRERDKQRRLEDIRFMLDRDKDR